jgi:hypothetical protein
VFKQTEPPLSGNKSFSEKRDKLEEHTGLFLNKWFLKKTKWNEVQIRERGEALADLAVAIWPSLINVPLR